MPSFNIINGGSHAGNALAMQEFMILPVGWVGGGGLWAWHAAPGLGSRKLCKGWKARMG